MRRRLPPLVLCAVLALVLLSGCSTSQAQISRHNAAVYVQGLLDETYTGAPQETYLTLMGRTEEDAKEVFANNLKAEYAQRLVLRFDLEDKFISRALREDYIDLLDTVYRSARYTVRSATPLEDGRYCVEVSVSPVTFFAAAYADGFEDLREEFEAGHRLPDEEAQERMTPAQVRKAQERYESAWAKAVYDYLYPRLDTVTTAGAVTKLVLVSPDSQGLYTLSPTDFQDLDDLILQY